MKFNVDNLIIPKTKTFEDLKNGEVFYTKESGTLWMKLLDDDYLYNSAVALDDGTVCVFRDNEDVIKIECEITEITLSN